jgi:hypothetical protein
MSGQSQQKDNSSIKDPKEWKSGDDPVTLSQQSYLETLAEQTGEQPNPTTLQKPKRPKRSSVFVKKRVSNRSLEAKKQKGRKLFSSGLFSFSIFKL